MSRPFYISVITCLYLWAVSPSVSAQEGLADLSLEELLDVEITSLSKKSERRAEAAGAVFVLTEEDIRRSGATSIPELLRTVPGISVARLDANKWAITSRGFSGRFANKLLVLIDGRSIYTPRFAGVLWEANNVLLEDVERIEVIRGPGGTVWGANAVNGVINIMTKSAEATQGALLQVRGGTEERGHGAMRYGGSIGDDVFYRAYGMYTERDKGRIAGRLDANDEWDLSQGGFRFDWKLGDEDSLMFSGDIMREDLNQTTQLASFWPPYRRNFENTALQENANLVVSWAHASPGGGSLELQASANLFRLHDAVVVDDKEDIYDIDFHHTVPVGDHSEINWGLGFRYVTDEIESTRWVAFDPKRRNLRVYSAFVQDEFRLFDDKLRVTVGSKFEYNDFTGLEVQPGIRAAWTPNDERTVWASISRAVRTPSRAEDDVHILDQVLPFGFALVLDGDRDFDSEKLIAYEAGYRQRITEKISFELATFYNVYDELRSIEVTWPSIKLFPLPPHVTIPALARNNLDAQTYGLEVEVDWRPLSWWRFRAGYSFLEIDLDLNPRTIDIVSGAADGDTPEQQLFVQNSFDLPHNLELDATLRFVDTLPSLDVDDYLTLDLRLGWRPRESLEIAIVGQNLLQPGHTEFSPTFVNTLATQAERGVYGEITWRF